MKTLLTILFFCLLQVQGNAKDFDNPKTRDTTAVATDPEGETIDEILKSRELPRKEKIEYLSQETKYGFKNLFKNYSYNSSMLTVHFMTEPFPTTEQDLEVDYRYWFL